MYYKGYCRNPQNALCATLNGDDTTSYNKHNSMEQGYSLEATARFVAKCGFVDVGHSAQALHSVVGAWLESFGSTL